MSIAGRVVVGLTVVSLGVAGLSALQPRTARQLEDQRRQDLVEQGGDTQEREDSRRREQARDGMDAEHQDRIRPGEHRPPSGDGPGRVRLR